MTHTESGAEVAIELCDKLLLWDMYYRTAVEEGVLSLREKMRQSMLQAIFRSDPQRREVLRDALAQWDHPDLLTHLILKLEGCGDDRLFY